jgi:hypothetical protein
MVAGTVHAKAVAGNRACLCGFTAGDASASDAWADSAVDEAV